jgi:hypothetical protein
MTVYKEKKVRAKIKEITSDLSREGYSKGLVAAIFLEGYCKLMAREIRDEHGLQQIIGIAQDAVADCIRREAPKKLRYP